MDGLMLDTEQLETRLYVQVSGRMGWPTPESVLRQMIGVNDDDTEVFYREKYGPEYPFREIWAAVKDEEILEGDKNGLPLKKGLLVLLDKLDRLGVPLAVATSTGCKRTKWKLSRAGILNRFTILTCGDEVQRGKPYPDIYLLAAERIGAEPADCVGFEDSPAGLMGLAAAGIPSVFVKDMTEPPPEVLRTVWRRCADLEEAASLFGDKKYGS